MKSQSIFQHPRHRQVLQIFTNEKWGDVTVLGHEAPVLVSNIFLCSPLFGEDSHFDYIIFFKLVETTN